MHVLSSFPFLLKGGFKDSLIFLTQHRPWVLCYHRKVNRFQNESPLLCEISAALLSGNSTWFAHGFIWFDFAICFDAQLSFGDFTAMFQYPQVGHPCS